LLADRNSRIPAAVEKPVGHIIARFHILFRSFPASAARRTAIYKTPKKGYTGYVHYRFFRRVPLSNIRFFFYIIGHFSFSVFRTNNYFTNSAVHFCLFFRASVRERASQEEIV
ncbi:MAG: hypothetical protein ACI3VP_09505, partial [Oscillospiraceae bacterium]